MIVDEMGKWSDDVSQISSSSSLGDGSASGVVISVSGDNAGVGEGVDFDERVANVRAKESDASIFAIILCRETCTNCRFYLIRVPTSPLHARNSRLSLPGE